MFPFSSYICITLACTYLITIFYFCLNLINIRLCRVAICSPSSKLVILLEFCNVIVSIVGDLMPGHSVSETHSIF